jgi:hypothetical protein
MSELPGRPDLDQLRRQARELLRAAADGEPTALTRLRAVSERVTLSAAQLAVAREHGFASWPALRAEAERRRAELAPDDPGAARFGTRWSFGGAAAIETAAGTLHPSVLIAGQDHATMHASLMPSGETQPHSDDGSMRTLREAIIGAVAVTDDRGTVYTLEAAGMSGWPGSELISLQLRVDPVPARERDWLELRGKDGSATRLLRSARLDAPVSRLAPVPDSPAERELSGQAVHLIGLLLNGAGQDIMEQYCSAALTRAAELQRSGAAGELADQLARLCALLTGHGPADGLPRRWADMINTVNHNDGARYHLDISAALPVIDGTAVRVHSVISEPESWRVYLRAEPGWWIYSADRNRKRAVMLVHAEDDRGGTYLSEFGGGSGNADHEELNVKLLPRLNPLARRLTLTFSGTGECEQAALEIRLPRRGNTTP